MSIRDKRVRLLPEKGQGPRLRLRVSVEGRREGSSHDRAPVLCVETSLLEHQVASFPADKVAAFRDFTATAWVPWFSLRFFPEVDTPLNIVEVAQRRGGQQLVAVTLACLNAISHANECQGERGPKRRRRRLNSGFGSMTALPVAPIPILRCPTTYQSHDRLGALPLRKEQR